MHWKTKKKKKCVTPFTALFTLLLLSGTEPAVSPWYACTDGSRVGECSFKYISQVGFLVSPPMLTLPSYKQHLPAEPASVPFTAWRSRRQWFPRGMSKSPGPELTGQKSQASSPGR